MIDPIIELIDGTPAKALVLIRRPLEGKQLELILNDPNNLQKQGEKNLILR